MAEKPVSIRGLWRFLNNLKGIFLSKEDGDEFVHKTGVEQVGGKKYFNAVDAEHLEAGHIGVDFSELADFDGNTLSGELRKKADASKLGQLEGEIDDKANRSEVKTFIINEDDVDISTDDTKGTAPYSTTYGYTNITIHEDAGIRWVEGAIYSFVIDTKLIVSSTYRNVRIRIGESDEWHPVMAYSSSILTGSSIFIKAMTALFQYKSVFQPMGALHQLYDANTTYAYLVNSFYAGYVKIDPNGYGARYSLIFPTTRPGDAVEMWSSLVKNSSTATTKQAVPCRLYADRHHQYIYSANINAGSASVNATYQNYTTHDLRYAANTSNAWVSPLSKVFLYLKSFDTADWSFYADAAIGTIFTLDKLATKFPSTMQGEVYLLHIGSTTTTWYTCNPDFDRINPIYKYTPSTGELVPLTPAGEGPGGESVPMTSITHSALRSLRDGGKLVPGMQYRITDYECTTTQDDSRSAGNVFDIIVKADSATVLNENARAALHAGDSYFASSNLETWELKYSLDNDTDRFAWANDEIGKGVIFYLKDEYGNECPYDFKNIQFLRMISDGRYDPDEGEDTYVYTFNWYTEDGECWDASIKGNDGTLVDYDGLIHGVYGNVIKPYFFSLDDPDNPHTLKRWLGSNVFLNYYEYDEGVFYGLYSNRLGTGCDYNTFGHGCYGNVLGDDCQYNTFGDDCLNNTFGDWSSENILGDGCSYNNFSGDCYENSFGNYCSYNTFRNGCESNNFKEGCVNQSFGYGCSYNNFGRNCAFNSFEDYCSSNTFGNSCGSNTFGMSCYSNTFGPQCSNNTFCTQCSENNFEEGSSNNSFGQSCSSNTFGTQCSNNTFGCGCSSNNFGNGCAQNIFGNNCSSNTFSVNCSYNSFGNACTSNTFGLNSSANSFGNVCFNNSFSGGNSYNALGNGSNSNTFGEECGYNSFGEMCTDIALQKYMQYFTLDNGVQYLNITCSASTSYSRPCKNVRVLTGVKGTSPTNKKTITISKANNAFLTTFGTAQDVVINV